MTTDKRLTLEAAAALITPEGCCLGLGGLMLYRRPMAFALAVLARHAGLGVPRNLTLLSFTGGLESDILVGAGMVARVRSCYFGLEVFGLAPHFTTAAGEGRIEIVEETEASLACGMRAAMAGVGFMPSTAWQGTDLPNLRPDVRMVLDPYTGEELTAFPPVRCNVAVLHALAADPEGNAILGGNWGVDRELALVADTVIVTTEKVVPRLAKADLIATVVHAVVETPGGAWPTSCHPLYPMDGLAVLRYTETAGTEAYPALLAEWIRHHHIS